MASRVYKTGTLVTRVHGMLGAGVLKERPLWLDVLETFPPLTPTKHNSCSERGTPPVLHYDEDIQRNVQHQSEEITLPSAPTPSKKKRHSRLIPKKISLQELLSSFEHSER